MYEDSPESIGGLVGKIAKPILTQRIEELTERVNELESAMRAILLCDYRGNRPPEQRIAEEAMRDVEP